MTEDDPQLPPEAFAHRGRVAAIPAQIAPEVYRRVFSEWKDGEQILEELTRRFARPAKLEGGIDAVLTTYHRDGARSVLEFIVNRINQANGVPADDD